MITRISPEEVREFHRLYAIHGTFAAVARITGRSAKSVAKYVRQDNPLSKVVQQDTNAKFPK